jgi:hypothetical protein
MMDATFINQKQHGQNATYFALLRLCANLCNCKVRWHACRYMTQSAEQVHKTNACYEL